MWKISLLLFLKRMKSHNQNMEYPPHAATSYVSLIHIQKKELKVPNQKQEIMNRRTKAYDCWKFNLSSAIHKVTNQRSKLCKPHNWFVSMMREFPSSLFFSLVSVVLLLEPAGISISHVKSGWWGDRHWWMTMVIGKNHSYKQTICGAWLSQNFLAVCFLYFRKLQQLAKRKPQVVFVLCPSCGSLFLSFSAWCFYPWHVSFHVNMQRLSSIYATM